MAAASHPFSIHRYEDVTTREIAEAGSSLTGYLGSILLGVKVTPSPSWET